MARLAAVWVALLLACSSNGGGSESSDCGDAGCKCTAEQGCDVGFECASSVEVCVPADCMPGFAACVCSDGQCTDGYHCDDGICLAGDTTLTSGPSSTGPDPSGSSTDPATSTGSAEDSTDPTSATMPTTEADGPETSSDEGEPTCADENDCEACFMCAIENAGPCASDHESCQEDDQCMGLETCASNCAASGGGGECVNTCCDLFEGGMMPPYSGLSACMNDACGDLCPDFAC